MHSKRWTIAAAVGLLVPVVYIISAHLLAFAYGAGWVSPPTVHAAEDTVYVPLTWYLSDTTRPGAEWLDASIGWVQRIGRTLE